MKRITATSRLCAVIGDPVEHSLSPQIHNSAFESSSVDLVYVAFHVGKGDLKRAMNGVRALGIRGLSVTIPHKVDVIPFLDDVDRVAQDMGSVNTVVADQGCLRGYTTDGYGALRALGAKGVNPAGSRILLIGSGGAARAIAFTLQTVEPKPQLTILGVDRAEMETLETELRNRTSLVLNSEVLSKTSLAHAMDEAEIVVHATPVGMSPKTEDSLIPRELMRSDQVFFDIVYAPEETRLLREASSVGAMTVSGLGMFVHQAAVQFELWTGLKAPIDVMTRAVTRGLGG